MHPRKADRTWCLEAAVGIAENLFDRAKAHANELYWDAGFPNRSAPDRKILEGSLGFGTPGILLFLAELEAVAPDPRIRACIEAAVPRILRLIDAAPASGFYVGSPGAIFTLLQVERLIGTELVSDAQLARLAERILADQISTSGALSNGHAGTLLAIELINAARKIPELDVLRQRLLGRIIAALNIDPSGLVVGRQFDAIRMPVNFYSGTSGIRHALSHYPSPGTEWIREGLRLYEEAAFDAAIGNWKDFINESFFNHPANAAKLNRALLRGDVSFFDHPGSSIGWGTGATGILLANEPESDSSARATQAILQGLSQLEPMETSMALFDGLGGIALSTSLLRGREVKPIGEKIEELAAAQYRVHRRFRTGPWDNSANLSLLNGEAGIGLYVLSLFSEDSRYASVLFPTAVISPGAYATESVYTIRTRMMSKHFPLTRQMQGELNQPEAPTLQAFIASAKKSVAEADELIKEVCDYECSRLELEAFAPPGVLLSCRDAYIEDVKSVLGDADNADLLSWKVRRVPGSKLGALPFSLHATGEGLPARDQQTLLILHHLTDGLHEHILTPETCQVLSLMEKAIPVKVLLAKGRHAWPLSERTPKEAEAIILATLRAGLSDGYIEFL